MDINQNALNNFLQRCDDLIGSNFILADKKITLVLKAIASGRVLFELFENCVKDYDFAQEFKKAADIAKRGGEFSVPSEPMDMLAFDFCLLMDFDNKNLDLHKFLQDCFCSDNNTLNEAFVLFNEKIIIPFKLMVKFLVNKMLDEAEEEEKDENSLSPADKLLLQHSQKLKAKAFDVKFYKGLNSKEINNFNDVYALLAEALASLDKKFIKGMFLGCRNTFLLYKRNVNLLNDTEEVLKSLGIL